MVAAYLIFVVVVFFVLLPVMAFVRRVSIGDDIYFTIWVGVCFIVSASPFFVVLYRNIDRLRERGFFEKN